MVEKYLLRIDDIEKKIIFKDRTTIHFEEIISIEYEEFQIGIKLAQECTDFFSIYK